MQLILVRHAEAVNLGTNGVATDFDRFLTPLGHVQATRLADALAARGIAAGAILTSPLVRAVQTAEPLARNLMEDAIGPVVNDLLACGQLKRKKLTRAAAELAVETAILVGHNPDLETYVGWLIGGEPTSVRLGKGAAASIRFDGWPDEGVGSLEWLLTPDWFMTEGTA